MYVHVCNVCKQHKCLQNSLGAGSDYIWGGFSSFWLLGPAPPGQEGPLSLWLSLGQLKHLLAYLGDQEDLDENVLLAQMCKITLAVADKS